MVFSLPWLFSGGTIASLITNVLQSVPVYAGMIFSVYVLVGFIFRVQKRFSSAKSQSSTPRAVRVLKNQLLIGHNTMPLDIE